METVHPWSTSGSRFSSTALASLKGLVWGDQIAGSFGRMCLLVLEHSAVASPGITSSASTEHTRHQCSMMSEEAPPAVTFQRPSTGSTRIVTRSTDGPEEIHG